MRKILPEIMIGTKTSVNRGIFDVCQENFVYAHKIR